MPLTQLDLDEGWSEAEAKMRQYLAEYAEMAAAPVREAEELQRVLGDPAALEQLRVTNPQRFAQVAQRARTLRRQISGG